MRRNGPANSDARRRSRVRAFQEDRRLRRRSMSAWAVPLYAVYVRKRLVVGVAALVCAAVGVASWVGAESGGDGCSAAYPVSGSQVRGCGALAGYSKLRVGTPVAPTHSDPSIS